MSVSNEEILSWLLDELNIVTEDNTEQYAVLFTPELMPMWEDLVQNYCHINHLASRKMNSLLDLDKQMKNNTDTTTTTTNSTTTTTTTTNTTTTTTTTTTNINNNTVSNEGDNKKAETATEKVDLSNIKKLLSKFETLLSNMEHSRQELDGITENLMKEYAEIADYKDKLHNHRLHTGMLLALDNKYNIIADKLKVTLDKLLEMEAQFSGRKTEKEAGFVTLTNEMQLQYPTGDYKVTAPVYSILESLMELNQFQSNRTDKMLHEKLCIKINTLLQYFTPQTLLTALEEVTEAHTSQQKAHNNIIEQRNNSSDLKQQLQYNINDRKSTLPNVDIVDTANRMIQEWRLEHYKLMKDNRKLENQIEILNNEVSELKERVIKLLHQSLDSTPDLLELALGAFEADFSMRGHENSLLALKKQKEWLIEANQKEKSAKDILEFQKNQVLRNQMEESNNETEIKKLITHNSMAKDRINARCIDTKHLIKTKLEPLSKEVTLKLKESNNFIRRQTDSLINLDLTRFVYGQNDKFKSEKIPVCDYSIHQTPFNNEYLKMIYKKLPIPFEISQVNLLSNVTRLQNMTNFKLKKNKDKNEINEKLLSNLEEIRVITQRTAKQIDETQNYTNNRLSNLIEKGIKLAKHSLNKCDVLKRTADIWWEQPATSVEHCPIKIDNKTLYEWKLNLQTQASRNEQATTHYKS